MKTYLIIFCTVACCFYAACKKTAKDDTPKTDFDRKSLLTNIGNNIIIPSYSSLQTSANTLDSMVTAFNANPDVVKLAGTQNAFKELYKAWQHCSVFELGTAEQINLSLNTNTFPTDTAKINSNITAGTYNLGTSANIPAKGLPAIDYLLFGTDNVTLLSLYITDSRATNRKQYLAAIATEIKTNVNTVTSSWSSGGNYINTFVSADGTDVGSSVGLLINKLNYDYEILKNYKLGIPLGKQSMGTLFPNKTEAYYSGISAQLAVLQLQAIQNIYLGASAQGDGIGFDDYLVQINAKYNGGSLNDTIKQQFSIAIASLQALSDPLSATIQNNTAQVNATYGEIQKLLVLLKTDMPSALGVLITYVDNDGD